jgi:hypothetical protein
MKNTFQLLTDTINHLQKLADNLGDLNKFKDAAQPELTRDTGKPKIELNYYYTVGSDGSHVHFDDENTQFEIDCENFYNVFKTKEEAQTEAAYTLASRRVRAFAKAVNGDWKADWENMKQEKYGIIYEECEIDVENRHFSNEFVHQIAFPTEELADIALKLFKPEWEILSNP